MEDHHARRKKELASDAVDTLFDRGLAHAQAPDDAALKWGPCPAFLPEGCQIAVLNGDPAKPNADLFFKVPAKSKLPSHWHTSAERLLLVSGELHVTYQGQETKIMKAGTYAYGLPKLPHSGVCVSAVPACCSSPSSRLWTRYRLTR